MDADIDIIDSASISDLPLTKSDFTNDKNLSDEKMEKSVDESTNQQVTTDEQATTNQQATTDEQATTNQQATTDESTTNIRKNLLRASTFDSELRAADRSAIVKGVTPVASEPDYKMQTPDPTQFLFDIIRRYSDDIIMLVSTHQKSMSEMHDYFEQSQRAFDNFIAIKRENTEELHKLRESLQGYMSTQSDQFSQDLKLISSSYNVISDAIRTNADDMHETMRTFVAAKNENVAVIRDLKESMHLLANTQNQQFMDSSQVMYDTYTKTTNKVLTEIKSVCSELAAIKTSNMDEMKLLQQVATENCIANKAQLLLHKNMNNENLIKLMKETVENKILDNVSHVRTYSNDAQPIDSIDWYGTRTSFITLSEINIALSNIVAKPTYSLGRNRFIFTHLSKVKQFFVVNLTDVSPGLVNGIYMFLEFEKQMYAANVKNVKFT